MNPDALRLLSVSAIRKLWPMRNAPKTRAAARTAIRAWVGSLRELNAKEAAAQN